jgi:hypothetical protein
VATIQGVGETLLGATGEVVGVALDATGVGAVVGVPINIASAGLIVHGSSAALQGGVHLAKSASESGGSSSTAQQSPADKTHESGSYTNTHESGRTYSGKGDRARSQASGRRIEKKTGDKHVATEWKASDNSREGFKDESRRIDANGGTQSNGNYNQRESPGKNYRKQDGSN